MSFMDVNMYLLELGATQPFGPMEQHDYAWITRVMTQEGALTVPEVGADVYPGLVDYS